MSRDGYEANSAHARALGLPEVPEGKDLGPLAIAGGGPSLLGSLDRLREFPTIWGANHVAQWLERRGIPAIFYSCDPLYLAGLTDDVKTAILASNTHPQIFAELLAAGADVRIFPTEHDKAPDWVASGGPTSVTRSMKVALRMGYTSVTFFGCEGSYGETSHAYDYPVISHQLIVRAGGVDYVTQPDFYMQCEYLATLIRELPSYFQEESGGLLRAMIEHPDTWDVVAASGAIAQTLIGDAPLEALPRYCREDA